MAIFYLLFAFSVNGFAKSEKFVFDSYPEIIHLIEKEMQAEDARWLIVFDIDHTLLNNSVCFEPDRKFKGGFAKFAAQVRECDAQITSDLLPGFIAGLKQKDVPVMALTARGGYLVGPTIRQLQERLFSGKSPRKLTFETAPLYTNKEVTIPFTQPGKRKPVLNKKAVMKNGVVLVSGANKGLALQAVLKEAEKEGAGTFDKIAFVDDSEENIDNLMAAYASVPEHMYVIHYTEFKKDKNTP